MKPIKHTVIFEAGVSALLALGAFAFFAFMYPYHQHYHEDLQLFLFTGDYAAQTLALPSGLATYLSRFVVQYFYHPLGGAAILALLIVACQLLTYRLLPRRNAVTYSVSLLPAMLMWAFLCGEDAMPAALIALIAAQPAALGVTAVKPLWPKVALWLIGTVALYWLFGPLALVFTLIVAVDFARSDAPKALKGGIIAAAIIVAVLCPLVAQAVYPYPLDRLISGIGYMRHPSQQPVLAWMAAVMVPAMMLLSLAVPAKSKSTPWRMAILFNALAMLVGGIVIRDNIDMAKEEIFAYHHLAGQQKWKEIITRAEAKAPADQMTAIYTNLALAKTGKLNDRLFDFPQHGTDGLVAPFGDHFFPPFATAEVFWQTGMVKPAMHYTYEIQQSIPDAQMSARCMRRLAETYMADGDTSLARKYLNTLKHSLYYSDWADKRLKALDKGANTYAAVADNAYTTDMIVDYSDPTAMFKALATDRPANQTAYDYLIASLLLTRDIEPLPEIIDIGGTRAATLPVMLQQALVLQWAHDHTSWDGLPWPISDEVKNLFIEFTNTYREGMPITALPAPLKNTYWSYYFSD